jgi:predicted ribosome quality control (RQC) complex YloA/Tae2 family protein
MINPTTSFQELMNELATAVVGNHITDIRAMTDRDYLVIFSETKERMLAISLRNEGPLAAMIAPPPFWSDLPKIRHEVLKHHLSKLKIDALTVLENHEVAILDCHKKGLDFQLVEYRLVLELIKGRPNLILIQNGQIIYAHKTFGVDQVRPLIIKGAYEAPVKGDAVPRERAWLDDIEKYRAAINQTIIDDQVKPWLKLARRRKMQLEKKIAAIEADQAAWSRQLDARDQADLLLTYDAKEDHADSVTIDGATIKLDPAYSIKDNARRLYKVYRKAKQAMAPLQEQLSLAQHEWRDLETLLDKPAPATNYDVEAVLETLRAWKLLPLAKEMTMPSDPVARLPYELVYQGTRYLFGRNAMQNDYLTFKYARPTDWFFHIKDVPGAHVIVQDPKPTPKMLTVAGNLAVILSKRSDGEVSYAQVQTLRKGKQPGQVLMKKSQSMRIGKVDDSLAVALRSAKRIQR